MATWYYYNANNEKIGPLKGRELKQLAQQGTITPETKIEDSEGRTAVAKNVTGLSFAGAVPSQVEDLGEQDFERLRADIDRLQNQQEKKQPVPQAPPVPPPAGPNPFSAPVPGTAPAGVNPFSAPVPPPILHRNRKPLGEMMAAAMQTTMSLITSAVGMVLALMLAVVVILLIWCLLEMANIVPRVLPYHPFLPPLVKETVKETVNDEGEVNGIGQEEGIMQPPNPPIPDPDAPPPEEDTGFAQPDQEVLPPLPPLDLTKAIPVSEIFRKSGFNSEPNSSLANVVEYGTLRLRDDLRQARNTLSRAPDLRKHEFEEAVEEVRRRIRAVREEIAKEVFYADYTYQVSNASVLPDNESSFRMSIFLGNNTVGYGVINDVFFPMPDVRLDGTVERDVNWNRFFPRGNTRSIEELALNHGNYRARVLFANLHGGTADPTGWSSGTARVEVLAIEVFDNRPGRGPRHIVPLSVRPML